MRKLFQEDQDVENVLNWIKFIIAFILVLTSVITVTVFYNASKPFSLSKKEAANAVMDSGQLVTISSVEIFNGSQPAVTVFGVDSDGEKKAVFVPNDKKATKKFKEVSLADGITKETAAENVKKELEVKRILHVSLGLEDEGTVWEVAFKSENGKLNYVYLYFENGQWWKRILNL